MEELESLIKAVAGLPTLAIWVVVAFWAYKVVVVGSIYGVIRFGISKAHDYLVRQKVQVVQVRAMLDSMAIGSSQEALAAQIKRAILATNRPSPPPVNTAVQDQSIFNALMQQAHQQNAFAANRYAQGDTVEWLRQAIDDKIAKDEAANHAA